MSDYRPEVGHRVQPNWVYGDHIVIDPDNYPLHLLHGGEGCWYGVDVRYVQADVDGWWSEGRVTVLVAEGRTVTA